MILSHEYSQLQFGNQSSVPADDQIDRVLVINTGFSLMPVHFMGKFGAMTVIGFADITRIVVD